MDGFEVCPFLFNIIFNSKKQEVVLMYKQKISFLALLVSLAMAGNFSLLQAQQTQPDSPTMSVVTLDVTGMT